MVGFGDPLLDGIDGEQARAEQARKWQNCKFSAPIKLASAPATRRLVSRGVANVAEIRKSSPLPETANELCTVAENVGAAPSDVWLGARATETEVKRLSSAGELARYRIVHFATHGAIAGDLTSSNEPGLILTPPSTVSETDDGYLSASEVAGLRLDADWVILSACNTAAGNTNNAEALSGLARAFFYAGARALLVSHWAVNSDAAVDLVTAAVTASKKKVDHSRAHALQMAMLKLISGADANARHPSYWGPFVLVGEGGAAP